MTATDFIAAVDAVHLEREARETFAMLEGTDARRVIHATREQLAALGRRDGAKVTASGAVEFQRGSVVVRFEEPRL